MAMLATSETQAVGKSFRQPLPCTKGLATEGVSRRLVFVRSSQASLDTLIDLFAMHGNVFRCVDADSYLLAADAQDGDRDVITDVYAFTNFAGEYKHGLLLDYF